MGDTGPSGGGSGAGGQHTVTFTLPSLPGSVNAIYEPGYSIGSSQPQWRLKNEWALWATRVKPYIPLFKVVTNSVVRIDRCYFYKYFYGNGNWRKADVANMDKLLFDVVAAKTGINDLYFKCGWMDSKDSLENKVIVTLTEITEAEWRRKGELNNET